MKKVLILMLLSALLLSACTGAPAGSTNAATTAATTTEAQNTIEGLHAGYSRCNITPEEVLPIDSGGVTPAKPELWQIYSYLEATVVVLADEGGLDNTVVLCAMDTLYADDSFVEAASKAVSEKTGIPAKNVFFSASHTHAAPDLDYGDAKSDAHVKKICGLIADSAQEAMEDLQPAKLRIGKKDLPGLNALRRFVLKEMQPNGRKVQSTVGATVTLDMIDTNSPYGGYEAEPDRQIQAIQLTREGTDIVLVNWQVHPGFDGSTGGISADYIYPLRASLETELMEDTVCAFFCGAGGNLNRTSVLETENRDLSKAQYGKALAQGVVDALKEGTDVEAGPIKLAHDTYTNTFKDWYPKNNVQAPLSLSAISIGDVSFITAPYEMFCENGVQIKNYAQENDLFEMTFICANTNGNRRYIPSQAAFDGDPEMETFEVHYAPFGAGAAEELVEKYQTLLQQLAGN